MAQDTQFRYFIITVVVLLLVIIVLGYRRYHLQKLASRSLQRKNDKIESVNHINEKLITELRKALDREKTLKGLLPICASFKKIRNDAGYRDELETYFSTHSICPECSQQLLDEIENETKNK